METKLTPSIMQRRLAKADSQDAIADFLIFLARADNWFDLYKGMERIEDFLGGERKVQEINSGWKKTRQTANRYRHAPSERHPLPQNPPTLEEARRLVLAVVGLVIDCK
ncbi:hypothetical protein QN219_24050 [Sinorhizobium sp. 7-81]|uniref:hypothetical protein n=1 Tax=Sinorhizobium sp. 8-89 TaxID=3049089 RepID=UPI0024C38E41|nr:hypothetical protein [Sinorhizobium sp. 8-89]MDK1493081.1 hypothetical protein [Sinorhizobium sp. 8-89]